MNAISLSLLPFVFLGGGFGAVLRWTLSALCVSFTGKVWSGTLLVNLLGCVILFSLAKWIQGEAKVLQSFWRIGFLGSLTTFSTFSFELVTLLKNGRILEACLVGFLNIFFGIAIGVWILR